MLCWKSPGPTARGPEEIQFNIDIKLSVFENVAALLFVAKSKLFCLRCCLVCRCGGAGGGGCEERRACPAPAAASSGRFRPVPAGAVQATAQHLRGSSFKKREKSIRPQGVRKKKMRNSSLSPLAGEGGGFGGERVGGRCVLICLCLSLS